APADHNDLAITIRSLANDRRSVPRKDRRQGLEGRTSAVRDTEKTSHGIPLLVARIQAAPGKLAFAPRQFDARAALRLGGYKSIDEWCAFSLLERAFTPRALIPSSRQQAE